MPDGKWNDNDNTRVYIIVFDIGQCIEHELQRWSLINIPRKNKEKQGKPKEETCARSCSYLFTSKYFPLLDVEYILTMAGKRESLLSRDDCGDANDGWMCGALLSRDGWR